MSDRFEPKYERVDEIIAQIKSLGAEYYALTTKPLGISGEIAEYEAARLLRLDLAPPREAAFDATRTRNGITEKLQIKGRAVDPQKRYVGRVSKMKLEPRFHAALLVLMDRANFDVLEIWQAEYEQIRERLLAPGSKSRNERLSMGISQFKSIAIKVWPGEAA